MTKELKVGDRVRVYGNTQIGSLEITLFKGCAGRILDVHPDGWLQVVFDGRHMNYTVHPKQCRKLKKRELREYPGTWVQGKCASAYNMVFAPEANVNFGAGDRARMREVVRKREGGGK